MRKLSALFFVAFLGLTACGGSDNDNDPIPDPDPMTPMTKVQIVHASFNAPKVDLELDGSNIAQDVDYLDATPVTAIAAGAHTAEVLALLPDGSTLSAFGVLDVDLTADTIYTVMAVGDVLDIVDADTDAPPLIFTRPDTAVTAGNVRVQIAHAAQNVPDVDIYVTAPDDDLSGDPLVAGAVFRDFTDALEVAAGDYRIRITLAGTETVAYDSGTISLADGADLVVAAVPNTGAGDHLANLLVIDNDGASSILTTGAPSDVRVFHASPDAPAVDIVANDGFAQPLITNLEYPDFVGYVSLTPDSYNIKVVASGTTDAVINADLVLEAGIAYNILAVNNLASIEPLVLTADNRRVATEAKLRVVHASPTAMMVDIYLVASGTDISTVDPTLSGVDFKADTGFLSVAEGDYDVVVTGMGSKTPAIGPAPISLSANGVYTIVAIDAAGGGTPLGVVLADDFEATE